MGKRPRTMVRGAATSGGDDERGRGRICELIRRPDLYTGGDFVHGLGYGRVIEPSLSKRGNEFRDNKYSVSRLKDGSSEGHETCWGKFVGDSETCKTSYKRTALSLVTVSLFATQVRNRQRLRWTEETGNGRSISTAREVPDKASGRLEARGSCQTRQLGG